MRVGSDDGTGKGATVADVEQRRLAPGARRLGERAAAIAEVEVEARFEAPALRKTGSKVVHAEEPVQEIDDDAAAQALSDSAGWNRLRK